MKIKREREETFVQCLPCLFFFVFSGFISFASYCICNSIYCRNSVLPIKVLILTL